MISHQLDNERIIVYTSGEASPIFSHAVANFEWLPLFISLEIYFFYGPWT